MDKKLYDKRKKPDCKKEQQRKEIFSTYSELCPQKPQDNRLSGLETGNKKTGKSGRIYDKILVWNIPPRITCPGVSDWCSTHCYNADARKDVYTIDRWCENLWDFHFRLPELKDKIENQINETTGRCAVRLHSSGDFFSEEYIDFWKEIILEFPKVSFWGYARCFTDVQTATARELFDVASSDILDKFISNLVNKCRIHNVISFRGWHSEWNSDLQVHYSFFLSFLFSVLKIGFVHLIHDAVHILRR